LQEVAWGLFGLSVEEMRERLRADLVAAHAEIFLINGDINSNLYTSTRAMHSAIIGLLQVPHFLSPTPFFTGFFHSLLPLNSPILLLTFSFSGV
jgi:hypothetical protein